MKLRQHYSVVKCHACGASIHQSGYEVRYSTHQVIPSGQAGKWVEIQAAGDDPKPHLRKTCNRCGYGWLEEVACPDECDA